MATSWTQAGAAGWMRAETEHFVLHAEGGEPALRQRAVQLERFHEAALLMLGIADGKARTSRRFDVVMLRDTDALNAIRPGMGKNYAGVYMQCADGSAAFAAETSRQRQAEDDFGQVVLFHEVAHRVMFEYANRIYPRWFVEGFAEYMGRTTLNGDRVTFGNAPPDVDAKLAGQWVSGRVMSWPELLRATSGDPKTEGDFYFKSWLLTHYLFNDSTRAQQLNHYLDRLAGGEDAVEAFEAATGLKAADLQPLLRRYARTAAALRMSGREVRPVEVKVTPLSEAQGEVLLQATTLRVCPAKSHGETLLAGLRKLRQQRESPVPELRLALARAELLFGDPAAAQSELAAVLAANDADFEAHHLMGRVLTAQASAQVGEQADESYNEARAHYFSAYRLNKVDAPNLYRMALALSRRGQDASLLNAARGARALEPTVPEYAFFEAQVDLQAGDRERAVRALRPLASNPHDAAFAARMRSVIGAIEAGKSMSDISRMLSKSD
jgi:tetratricopeptide (TPR) repeat protein